MWQTVTGSKPLVAAAYDAIRSICSDMIVVVGHEANAVQAALGDRVFQLVHSDPDAAMFESIRAGLQAAQLLDPAATVVVQPGDHPEIARETLELLANASLAHSEKTIIPVFGGRGGHPVFIPSSVAVRLLHANCPTGLGEFWKAHPDLCLRVSVGDAAAVRDVDTPADLIG
jgi:molybdenum cofactor cytidylyltransferase